MNHAALVIGVFEKARDDEFTLLQRLRMRGAEATHQHKRYMAAREAVDALQAYADLIEGKRA